MKIAFHSPLKSPNYPVPSGDRLMARLLITALERAGYRVELASELRTFLPDPAAESHAPVRQAAAAEVERLAALWHCNGPPDAWLCYHPYYKAPDLIGPPLAAEFAIPYITAEASYSARRNLGGWSLTQDTVLAAVNQAAVNICFTQRDLKGLAEHAPSARFAKLVPFIDPAPFLVHAPAPRPCRLIVVAMMRRGDKRASFMMLADALEQLAELPWTLGIVGDGPCRAELEARFAGTRDRITWHGEKTTAEIAVLLSESALYVWPGCGEAYGLAYLEAQAAGVPVVAQAIAGVPEVVADGRTGVLTPANDTNAYAGAIARLLTDEGERARLAAAARAETLANHSIDGAARQLNTILLRYAG